MVIERLELEVVIADIDDTLADCLKYYRAVNLMNTRILQRNLFHLDLGDDDVKPVVKRISDELELSLGRSRKRYQETWRRVYEHFLKKAIKGAEVDENSPMFKEIIANTEMPYARETYEKNGLMPGVEGALDYLVSEGVRLCLLTRETLFDGEPSTQDLKIDALGLRQENPDGTRRWFEDRYTKIVPEKTVGDFEELLGGVAPERAATIGDSWQDIWPGVDRLNMWGFHVYDPEGWNPGTPPEAFHNHPRIKRIPEFALMPEIYPWLNEIFMYRQE
ncbi:MAG: HAD family hydrolase [archaeon]